MPARDTEPDSGDHVLFTDGSLNPQRRIGIGIALLVPADYLEQPVKDITADGVAERCFSNRFTDTSATQLEVETALWALAAANPVPARLYTDSQCIVRLPGRRDNLQRNDYLTKSTGKPIRHADLYRHYFALRDGLGFEEIKVSGHSDYRYQDTLHRIFHYVDREARRQLKQWLREIARSTV